MSVSSKDRVERNKMDKRVDTTDCINFLAMAVGFVKLDNKWHSDELTTGRRH